MTKKAIVTYRERELHVERIFEAPRDRLWTAVTNPELLAKWWGRGNELDIEIYEFKRGGHWRFVEHTPHGLQGFEGRFSEIEAPARIVRSFEWDGAPAHSALETMRLEDLGDGRTKLVVVSLSMLLEDLEMMKKSGMEGGMNQSYDALDRVLASM